MKLDTETLRELIREAIREQEETSTQRTNDQIYDDIVGELARSKDNEGVRELMLNFLDALTNPQKIQEACGMAHPMPQAPMMGGMNDDDHEVEMAISDLHKLEEYAPKVSQLAGQYSNLPGWVQAKITLAADYLGKVYHYLDGKHKQGM
jgi:hypothetical protein